MSIGIQSFLGGWRYNSEPALSSPAPPPPSAWLILYSLLYGTNTGEIQPVQAGISTSSNLANGSIMVARTSWACLPLRGSNATLILAIMPRPQAIVCELCGGKFFKHSFTIHQKQCIAKVRCIPSSKLKQFGFRNIAQNRASPTKN